MPGWQLADQIHDRWARVRVGLITGWGARIQDEELQAHNVDFLIAKPVRRDQVLSVLSPEATPARRARGGGVEPARLP